MDRWRFGAALCLAALGACRSSPSSDATPTPEPDRHGAIEAAHADGRDPPGPLDSIDRLGAGPGQSVGGWQATPVPNRGDALDSAGPRFAIVGPAPDDPAFNGLAAAELEPLALGDQRWLVLEGEDRGASFVRSVAGTDRFQAQIADRWGDLHTHFLRRDGEQVVMPANTSHEDKAITLFEPPLVVAPPRLTSGAPFIARARMRVVEERDPSKVMHLGRCERTLTLEGRDVVRTPMGELVAMRVRMEFRATLQLATASEVATLHVVPGLGVVAEERVERINALGFVNRTRRSVVVRLE